VKAPRASEENRTTGARARGLRKGLIRAAFLLYNQLLSPALHAGGGASGACRFQPTCSEYAALALETHGIFRGTALALRRLAKCHPLHAPAYDPVPPAELAPAIDGSPAGFLHASPPPVTIDERGFPAIPSAGSRPGAATPPQVRR